MDVQQEGRVRKGTPVALKGKAWIAEKYVQGDSTVKAHKTILRTVHTYVPHTRATERKMCTAPRIQAGGRLNGTGVVGGTEVCKRDLSLPST